MSAIIDELDKDHVRFRRYLTAFHAEIGKLADGRGPDYGLLENLAAYFSQYPDELHHKKEDIVYARLEENAQSKRRALEDLQAQHEELSHKARHFAEIVKNILSDQKLPVAQIVAAAEDYAAILSAHMQGEEETLFAPARRLFKAQDWSKADEDIADLYAKGVNFEKMRRIRDIEGILDTFLEKESGQDD